jgi:hypothetical protein
MLSFSTKKSGHLIQLYCDDAGIAKLIDVLSKLRGSGSHIHLRAPPAGGNDLSCETPFGEEAATEVIITHGGDQWSDFRNSNPRRPEAGEPE